MARFKVRRVKTYETYVEAPDIRSAFDEAHYLPMREWQIASDRIAPEVVALDGAIQRLVLPPEEA